MGKLGFVQPPPQLACSILRRLALDAYLESVDSRRLRVVWYGRRRDSSYKGGSPCPALDQGAA